MPTPNELAERLKRLREANAHKTSAPPVSRAGVEEVPTSHSNPTEIPDGHKAYSEIFGAAPSGREYAVPVFNDDDWEKELQCYIPEPDTGYIFPAHETERLVTGFIRGKRSHLLHGPKGSGKSTLTEQIAARLRIPFVRVNMSEDAESGRIFGTVDVQEGSMKWVPGPAEIAARAGNGRGCFLQVDEVSATPAGVNLAMQWMLEKNGKIFNPERVGEKEDQLIQPGPMFRIVCTDNTVLQGDTTGKYAGTNVQNEAFLDRMSGVIHIGYLGNKHEKEIIKSKYPDVPDSWVNDMLKIARLIRAAYDSMEVQNTLSPRGLLDWADEALFWGDLAVGFRDVFYNKLLPDDQRVVSEHYRTVTGVSLSY